MRRFNLVPLVTAIVFAAPFVAHSGAAAAPSALIINEIDYDQPGFPDNGEFVELKNVSQKTIDLTQYTLEIWDGANLPGENYLSMNFIEGDVPPGEYFVICGMAGQTTLTENECNRNASNTFFNLKNLDRFGILLKKGEEVVDMVSIAMYMEMCSEGGTFAPKDRDTKDNYSVSRVPDGLDTDNNGFDFRWTCSSPRAANLTDEECICRTLVCGTGKACNPATGLCEVVVVHEDVIEDVGGEDTATPEDAGTGQDQNEPADVVVADSAPVDTSVADSVADSTTPSDRGTVDAEPEDTGPGFDIRAWYDLPVYTPDGEAGNDGCSAGNRPAEPLSVLLMVLLACLSFAAFGIARKSRRI